MMPRSIATYELYIAALKLGVAIIPCSEMLRTKDLQYRITHGEINAVIALEPFTVEFEKIKEYDALTKFVIHLVQLAILKPLHIVMDGDLHIYKWHQNIGYVLMKMT